jgi:P27 family predicted phage terminase small subunit
MPTHLKLLRGNPAHRPLNKDEPEPSVPIAPPSAPEFLSEYAHAEWDRVAKELYQLRLLTTVDIAPLAAYCESYAAWRTAVEKLKEMAARDPVMAAFMIKTRHGSVMRSRISTVEAQPAPGKFDGLLVG